MGDIEEMNADMDEANDILNQQTEDVLTDEDLLAEFEELGADKIEEDAFGELVAAPQSESEKKEDAELLRLLRQDSVELAALKDLVVPNTVPQVKRVAKTKEEEELANLEAQMLA